MAVLALGTIRSSYRSQPFTAPCPPGVICFFFHSHSPAPTHSRYPHLMTDFFSPLSAPPKYPCLFANACVWRSYIFTVCLFGLTGDKVCVIKPAEEAASLAKLMKGKVALSRASTEGHLYDTVWVKTVTVMVHVAFVGSCQSKLATNNRTVQLRGTRFPFCLWTLCRGDLK